MYKEQITYQTHADANLPNKLEAVLAAVGNPVWLKINSDNPDYAGRYTVAIVLNPELRDFVLLERCYARPVQVTSAIRHVEAVGDRIRFTLRRGETLELTPMPSRVSRPVAPCELEDIRLPALMNPRFLRPMEDGVSIVDPGMLGTLDEEQRRAIQRVMDIDLCGSREDMQFNRTVCFKDDGKTLRAGIYNMETNRAVNFIPMQI
ncbi:MAG: hypothetical protein LBN30_07285 [Oscillospiraceae bacterium]|jgi:hypothetical protein|nr:hypothetical protein [Oscillospiraceae bacterium]